MPQEQKRRRRKEKRKHEEEEEEPEKRIRIENQDQQHENEEQPMEEETADDPQEHVYFGMLNDEEQEYFRHADEMLELDQFGSPEERKLFLANVWREAEDKELKIACSQSSSRLMERLIKLSTHDQLKNLFKRFNGHFLHLVQHRFASHCCETLFTQAAPVVSKEMKSGLTGEEQASMENMFLFTVNEFVGNLGYLMTDRFGSHALRVLLLVLAGRPLEQTSAAAALQSKRKEQIAEKPVETAETREVPKAFSEALDKIMSDIVSKMDTSSLRALSTHQIGNPVLQILLELDIERSKESGTTSKLLKELLGDSIAESDSYISGMLYDPVGSRLLETVVRYAPGKTFKELYRASFKERIAGLARNDISGYVVIRILERLGKRDFEEAIGHILPLIPNLIDRSRTVLIKTIVERCAAREVDGDAVAGAIRESYGGDNVLLRMLRPEAPASEKLHGSLLAQAMVVSPAFTNIITGGLLSASEETLSIIAQDPVSSHVIQQALAKLDLQFQRQLIPRLIPVLGDLCTHSSGSHVVDALWSATERLEFLRERVAGELVRHEAEMRESFIGRAVWRNWMLDIFKRRKADWIRKAREKDGIPEGKSAIQLARERHAKAVRV